MDRDVYLILVGIILSAVFGAIMRGLELILRHIARKLYFARSAKKEKERIRKQLMGIKEDDPYKYDFWIELFTDIGKLRGGGGTWLSHLDTADYVIYSIEILSTIGVFIYWVVVIMPSLK